jgi:hypothetical protein
MCLAGVLIALTFLPESHGAIDSPALTAMATSVKQLLRHTGMLLPLITIAPFFTRLKREAANSDLYGYRRAHSQKRAEL